MKYIRREDINLETRINIVLIVLFSEGSYGTITRLSKQYNVSRTFIYQLIWMANVALIDAFSGNTNEKGTRDYRTIDKVILLLRLEGKCSIQDISNILKSMGYYPCSEGYISQRLKYYGLRLSNTLEGESIQLVLFLSDEIFANNQPILVTIEPEGTTILRIELADKRDAETWKNHWIEIEKNNYFTIGLVSDRGKGLIGGFKEAFEDKPYYPDHFHEFRALARVILCELEKNAYKAIKEEDERAKVFDSAKSDRVQNERFRVWERAVVITEETIIQYEAHLYLFECIKNSLELFDKEGNFQDINNVKGEIMIALELMGELSHKKVNEIVNNLKQKVDEFLFYFEKAGEVYEKISHIIEDNEVLKALCLAWQYDHKIYQANTGKQKIFYIKERDYWLEYAEGILGEDIKEIKEDVFKELNTVVRSSSLVEMVNSLIRPYLETCKGRITQETLNLIMFYHNHHKFNSGKRGNKSPIEILTGKSIEKEWVDLLLDDYGDFEIDKESPDEGSIVNRKATKPAILNLKFMKIGILFA